MATNLQGSLHAAETFTVRTTVGVSSADFTVTAGTTYDTADDVLTAWNAVLASIGVSVARVVSTDNHTATVQVTSSGGAFSVTWSHLGDGSDLRDYLGEAGDLSAKASGYSFAGPLAAAWFPAYDMRRLDISAEPWSRQRLMTGGGAVTTNNPHHNTTGDLKYDATAVFWFGSNSGNNYLGYAALRDFIDGVLTYGQPFKITTDDQAYTCRLHNAETLEIIPEPVSDIKRGNLYEVAIPVVVIP